ncbi:hypothetical protein SLA2020_001840 [Shorea laevis]
MAKNVDHALKFQLVEIPVQQVTVSSKGGKSTASDCESWKRIDRNLTSTHNLKKEIRGKRKNMQQGMEDERASKVFLDNLGIALAMQADVFFHSSAG